MKMYLNIFSGLENPSYILNKEEIQQFMIFFKTMDKMYSNLKLPGNLGYNGFSIIQFDKNIIDCDEIIVFSGVVYIINKKIIEYYIDSNQNLEKWLLSIIKKNIDKKVYEDFIKENIIQ
jgi:hypothetical protein